MNNFDDTFKKFRILSCDTEILKDYFSFGFKIMGPKRKVLEAENLRYFKNNRYLYECKNDEDCYKFSEFYKKFFKENTIQIFYNSPFDKAMIDILLSKVSNKGKNILSDMRYISFLICNKHIDYWGLKQKILDKEISFDKLEERNEEIQRFYMIMNSMVNTDIEDYFFVDAPTVGGMTFVDKEKGKLRPGVSLKKNQMILFDRQLKFDFSKYEKIIDIRKDGFLKDFLDYSLFDLDSLEKYILIFCSPVFENRFKLMKFHKINLMNYKLMFSNDNLYLVNYLYKIKKGGN